MVFFFFKILVTVTFYIILGKLTVSKILKYKEVSFIDTSIIGIISASFIALIVNFFFPLNQINNSIFLILIFLFFLFLKFKFQKIEYLFILLASILSFAIILFDNEYRPDAGLYHLPYTQILNDYNIFLGLINLHTRFGHISIIQYLSAFNLNIITEQIGIIIPISIIFSFIYIYFLYDIQKLLKKKEKFSIGKIFSLFILIYITYKINRYSEFGNDAPAHLLFFYLISKILYLKKNSFENLHKIYLYSAYLFLNKIFFIFIFIFPFYLLLQKKKFFLNIAKSIPTIFIFSWILKNLLVSGCLFFPIKISCFESLKWTNLNLVESANIEADAWAKAWPQNLDINISMKEFTKNFRWVEAWMSVHFRYIVKILLPYILFMILILFYILNTNKKTLNNLIKDDKLILFILLSTVGFISFFLKFPVYRYGYSYLILSIFMTFFWSFKFINKDKFLKICRLILPLSLIIITSKQLIRYKNNYNTKSYIPNHILIDKSKFNKKYSKSYLSDKLIIYYSKNECFYGLSPCTNYKYDFSKKSLKYEKKFIFNIIYL